MKNVILSFLNRPLLVIALSLVAAGAIESVTYSKERTVRMQAEALALPQAADIRGTTAAGHLTLAFLTGGSVRSVMVKVGDTVHTGDTLAALDPENTLGALTQAQAAYASAQAIYQKVLKGATGPTIDVAKAAVATAKTGLSTITTQQDALVASARRKLYSDGLEAVSETLARRDVVPSITGAYDGEQSGQYIIFFEDANSLTNRSEVSFSGLEEGVVTESDVPQAFGMHGLLIAFPTSETFHYDDRWTIDIPNKNGANYVANLNAYQAAVQIRTQAVAAAQAALDQANAQLALTVAAARPEDIAAAEAGIESAKGAMQVAQASYDSRIIKSPEDAVVSAVHISAGEVAPANVPAIELSASQ